MKEMIFKRGQIWIETVIYILIALIMIGAVLAFINPKIKEIQDKLSLDKTIEMLEELNLKISEVGEGTGNIRIVYLEIKKGELKIDDTNEKVTYVLEESKSQYSEPTADPNSFITKENVKVQTIKKGKLYIVTLELNYLSSYDLIGTHTFTKSSSAYKLSIENEGNNKINIKVIS